VLADPEDAPGYPQRFPFLEVLPAVLAPAGTLIVAEPTLHRIAHELWAATYPEDWNVLSRQALPFRRHIQAVLPLLEAAGRVHYMGDLLPRSLLTYAAYRQGGIDAEPHETAIAVSYRGISDDWLDALGDNLIQEQLVGRTRHRNEVTEYLHSTGIDWNSTLGPRCYDLFFNQGLSLTLYQAQRWLHNVSDHGRGLWNGLFL